jgi:hypothetical protein
METWAWIYALEVLVILLTFSGLFGFTLWVARAAQKEEKEKEQWFQKRLEKTAWKVEPGERRLRSLDIPPDLLRQYPGWSRVRLVSLCRTDQRTSWLFRLKPVLVSVTYKEIVCIVQSSSFDFPRVTLRRKSHRRRVRLPRSSRLIRYLYPGLCRHWVVCAEDEGERTLSLLSRLKGVLQQVRETKTVDVAPGYVAIGGEQIVYQELREHLFEFIREVRCILQSIGEPDPFDGAFGSGGLPGKHS